MKRLTNVYSINQQAMAAASRIFEVLDTKEKIMEKPGAPVLAPFKKEVRFKNVAFAYDDKEILRDINITISAGEIAAFVGPSGVGKTTLVNLIPRFYDATKGGITVDGGLSPHHGEHGQEPKANDVGNEVAGCRDPG